MSKKKWEYLVDRYDSVTGFEGVTGEGPDMQADLDFYGTHGWELVPVFGDRFIFKRPAQPSKPAADEKTDMIRAAEANGRQDVIRRLCEIETQTAAAYDKEVISDLIDQLKAEEKSRR